MSEIFQNDDDTNIYNKTECLIMKTYQSQFTSRLFSYKGVNL